MTIISRRRKSTYNNNSSSSSHPLVVVIDHVPFPPFYNHLLYLQKEVPLRPEPMNLLHSYCYGCVTHLVMLHDAIICFLVLDLLSPLLPPYTYPHTIVYFLDSTLQSSNKNPHVFLYLDDKRRDRYSKLDDHFKKMTQLCTKRPCTLIPATADDNRGDVGAGDWMCWMMSI